VFVVDRMLLFLCLISSVLGDISSLVTHTSGGKKTEPSKREPNTNESNHGHKNQKNFSIKLNKICVQLRRSPPTLPHLIIGIEIYSWLTSNLGNTK
jgi:hypothetical protein